MDFETMVERGMAYYHGHPILAFLVIGAVCFIFYFKPKEMFKLLVLAAVAGALFYIILQLGESASVGVQSKDHMIYKSREVME